MDIATATTEAVSSVATPGGNLAYHMLRFVVQLAVIIMAARVGGYVFRRLRLPEVLGELISGVAISPYALGSLAIPMLGRLFDVPGTGFPITNELYAVATLASILLLFLSGLETDLSVFLKYSVVGTVVGLGGVIFSFALGAGCAVWLGGADALMSPAALFMGTVATATSVGITARILTERRQMDSPEGVTILAGAVFDDVLGIVVLAVVSGMTKLAAGSQSIEWGHIGLIALRAVGFWLGSMAIGLLLARRVAGLLKPLGSPAQMASIALGLALLLAGLSEMAGLAMIIGAYVMGLSLSRTDLAHVIHHELHGLYQVLVPVFFCVMGMLVDLSAVGGALLFGGVYTAVGILSKLFGCALPAWLTSFNLRGALRVGIGMVPRGEVALIVAGLGLAGGYISRELFGVAVLMTMITTTIAPPLLIRSFRGGSGLRHPEKAASSDLVEISLDLSTPELAEFMFDRVAREFESEEFYVARVSPDVPVCQIRKDDIFFTLSQEGSRLLLRAPKEHGQMARLVLLEELLLLKDMVASLKTIEGVPQESHLLDNLF